MAFFEFNDERNKVDPLQKTMGAVAFEETIINGKSSADPNVWHIDTLVRKPNIFQAIKNGTYKGIAYNMNSDVFELINRPKTTLDQCVPSEVVIPPWSTTSYVPPMATTEVVTTGESVSTTGTTGMGSTSSETPATTGDSDITTGESNETTFNAGSTSNGNLDEEESDASSLVVSSVVIISAVLATLL